MSRQTRRRRRRGKRPAGRWRTRTSYRESLVAAIREWFPAQFFGQWKLRRGLLWTPQRIVWMAVLLVWSAEQTLTSRFTAVADVLQTLFPRWRLGESYTGWHEAQLRWVSPLGQAVTKRLRQQMREHSGPYWDRGNRGTYHGDDPTIPHDEPGHPIGMPFPGGFTVERRDDNYYCPIRDKEKDVPFAICNFCPAKQSEMP